MIIKDGKALKVGFTCSAFDLCHAGHVSMLEEAKSKCDWLIVGLQTDPSIDRPTKNRPVQTLIERQIQIEAVRYVDQVICYATEQDLEDILSIYPIDIRILGVEYIDKDFTGKSICERRHIELYFNKRDHRFSSTDLRCRVVASESKSQI